MWKNRWVRVGLVAVAIFVINGASRLISRLAVSDNATWVRTPWRTSEPARSCS